MNRPERAPARPALAPATDRSWLSRIRDNPNYAEEMIIPKYAAKCLLLHGFVQKLRDNKYFSVSLRV